AMASTAATCQGAMRLAAIAQEGKAAGRTACCAAVIASRSALAGGAAKPRLDGDSAGPQHVHARHVAGAGLHARPPLRDGPPARVVHLDERVAAAVRADR